MRVLFVILALCLSESRLLSQANDEEFQQVVKSYGPLVTLAGTGLSEDLNDWKAEFEGKKGTEVELSNPHMAMADAAGNVYIADKESHSILKVSPTGLLTTFAGTHLPDATVEEGKATEVPLNNPNGLHVFPDGTVFILDFLNNRVRKVTPEGRLTTVFKDDDGFGPGRALWVRKDEQLIYYCGAGTVKKWTPSGGVQVMAGGLTDPGNLDVDPRGNVVITDRAAHLVYRIEAEGKKTVIAGNGNEGDGLSGVKATDCALDNVRGIAFLPNGAYFLATMKGGDIWYVDTKGFIHEFLIGRGKGNVHAGEGEPVTTPGEKISEPRSVTIAPNGDLVITCNDTGYLRVVRKIQPKPAAPEIKLEPKQSVRLRWRADAGRSYLVEGSGDLKAWRTLASIPAKDAPVTAEFIHADSPAGSWFFRVGAP